MKRILVALVVLMAGIALFYSCKKDKANNSIIGVWENHNLKQGSQVYADTFVFTADSAFTETRTIKDTLSGATLGYQYLCKGKFNVAADRLTLTASSTKASNNYGDISQLAEVTFVTVNIMRHTFVFNSNGSMFYFPAIPCGINENCLGTLYYYRQ